MTKKAKARVEAVPLYHIIDVDTGDPVFSTPYTELPKTHGGQLTIDLWVDGNRTHHLYIVDHIDENVRTIWVKLNKVYFNDNPIIPVS